MSKWYEIKKDESCINDFLTYTRGFHDCKIAEIKANPKTNSIDVFLQFNSKEGVILRFLEAKKAFVNMPDDYPVTCLYDTNISIIGDFLIWYDAGEGDESFEEIRDYYTWIMAEKIIFSYADGEGNEQDIPKDRIYSIFDFWNQEQLDELEENGSNGDDNIYSTENEPVKKYEFAEYKGKITDQTYI